MRLRGEERLYHRSGDRSDLMALGFDDKRKAKPEWGGEGGSTVAFLLSREPCTPLLFRSPFFASLGVLTAFKGRNRYVHYYPCIAHLQRLRRFASTWHALGNRTTSRAYTRLTYRDSPLPAMFPFFFSIGHELGSPDLRRLPSREGGLLAAGRDLPSQETKKQVSELVDRLDTVNCGDTGDFRAPKRRGVGELYHPVGGRGGRGGKGRGERDCVFRDVGGI